MFRISVPADELGIQNLELRVIDTPGLLDTRGLEQDAKFLATLDEYLINHEELSKRIPNIVFVFHKFTDNRFSGVGSNFVRMLRGLDSFRPRITDSSYSNVIFVLSYFCSEITTVKGNPMKRLQEFRKVIEDYTLCFKPIVIAVAENKAEDHNLPLVNGYYKLPNGDLYPRNLFDKIQKVTQSAGDQIGDAIIRTAFRNSENFNISSHTFTLVGSANRKVSHYFKILINVIFDVGNTEVSQLLDKSIQTMKPQLKQQYPNSLPYLRRALNIRNILTRNDIPQSTLGILELLGSLRKNEAILHLLEDGIQITPPLFPTDVIVGHNFHVFKDAPLTKTPFALGRFIPSDIGYLLPTGICCSLEQQVVDFIKFHPTRLDYLKERIQQMGIEVNNITIDCFTGQIRPGFNIETESFSNTSCKISAVREFRSFQFVINQDKFQLSEDFKNTLLQLPIKAQENVSDWNNFFKTYGTHVVQSVYGGGAIEISLQSNVSCDFSTITEALFNVIQFAEDLTVFKSRRINYNDSLTTTSSQWSNDVGIAHQLQFKGGDPRYHSTNLTKMTLDDASVGPR